MINLQQIGESSLRFFAILLASILFLADLLLPGFNTGGILYQSLFILSLWVRNRQNTLMLACLCTLFIAGGYWFRHGINLETFDLFSRSISLLGIWSIAVIGNTKDKLLGEISERENKIKTLIEERTYQDREQFIKKTQALQLQMRQLEDEAKDLRLAEDAHRLAKEVSESENRAKSAFLNNMSVEIQTPMQGIIEMAGKLDNSPLDGQQRDFVYSIRSSGESLLSITNDIMDFSNIEAGDIEIVEKPFILRDCIEDAFDLVINRISQKNIEVSYTIDPSIPASIVSDPVRVKQVIQNLLSNAVQRTTNGEIYITAKLLEKTSEGYVVYFSMQDSGPAIPQEQLAGLFESSLSDVLRKSQSDIGLGMAISTRLCTLLGGKIWAESNGQQGAVFQFVLTVQKASRQEIPLQGKPWFIGKHILVVDDNVNVRRFLNHQLKNWGMQTTVFANGPEAMRWYAAGHVCDLALIDLDMPVLDGLTLAHQMRQSNKDLPIVLMPMIGSRVTDAVLSGVLPKPLKQQRLYDQINAILSLKSTTEAEFIDLTKNKTQKL
ncbi:MAG: ATP-binding protein [Bacteroidota bacterium]